MRKNIHIRVERKWNLHGYGEKLKIRVRRKRNLRGYEEKTKNPCKWKKEFTRI